MEGFLGDEAPRKFVHSLTKTLEGTLQFLRGFTIEVRPKAIGTATMHIEPTIDRKEINNFVSVARLKLNRRSGLRILWLSSEIRNLCKCRIAL